MKSANQNPITQRFNDDERITRALRRAAEFARLRREMWARFRASIASESDHIDEGTQERKLRAAAPPPRDQRPTSD